ncbi:diguanylate cyclase (plasmid) [Deinococcus taeanensis]|uniref:diguanylate cyclase n=1 Tax=Deinococcus taeanensis TaxID=2737050 RepID=UPI001CDC9A71|nr:diguanylate cyclase [Deinococcus taeanensis]UBV44659.1 diguanylate cyclase [Deinococcus taeanensis]
MERGLRILIVDDDEDDFLLTRDLLRDVQGWTCRVTWADGIETAAEEIASGQFDVYLVDYRLGAHSGLDVLQLLKASLRSAPAILLTGVDNREVDVAAMKLGAADYLVKSDLSTVVLERSLRYALERMRLLQEVEQARQEIEGLFQLSTALEQAGSVQDVMRHAAALLLRLASVDTFLLWELRDEVAVVVDGEGESDAGIDRYRRSGLPRSDTPLWKAIEQLGPLYADDVTASPHVLEEHTASGFGSLAHVPLDVNGKVYVLSFLRRKQQPWRDRDRRLLEVGSRSIGVALERRRSLELLAAAAMTDRLTGLGNRRAFDAALDAALNSASRHGHPVSVASFDLDGLKVINDGEGHARGDEFLRAFAQAMKARLRREDLLYRFGGDEFVAILNHTGPDGATALLLRLRAAVADIRATGFPGADVSAGVASFPAEAVSGGDLLRLSDERMYQEKLRHRAEKRV